MKTFTLVCALFLVIGLAACGSPSSSSSNDNTTDESTFTATDAHNVGAGLNNAQNAAYSDIMNQFATDVAKSAEAMALDVSKASKSGTIVVNRTYNCQVGGHITLTGNFNWTYNYPVPPSDSTPVSFSIGGQLKEDVSDPTNNLYDCEQVGGVILDGTLYSTLTASGDASSAQAKFTTDGVIGINRRGPTGGLVPIANDCAIFLTVTASSSGGSTSGGASGTICGQSYSYSY